MSYKKQQPKLADILNVFINRLEEIEKSISKLEKINHDIDSKKDAFSRELDRKLTLLEEVRFNVDLSNLLQESDKINANLIKFSQNTADKFRGEIKVFDQSLNKISKFRMDYILYFLICSIGITLCSTFYAGSLYVQKSKEEEIKEHYKNFIKQNETVFRIYQETN